MRVRSVRCLNEDGVISNDCLLEDTPASYEFCNQIDCVTSSKLKKNNKKKNRTSNCCALIETLLKLVSPLQIQILPCSLTHILTLSQLEIILQNYNPGNYMVVLDTTESDGSGTTLLQTVTPQGTTTQLFNTAAMNIMTIVSSDGDSNFVDDGENILNLNNVEQTDVADDDTINFQNNTIIPGSGDLSVDTFVFFDWFVTICSAILILLIL